MVDQNSMFGSMKLFVIFDIVRVAGERSKGGSSSGKEKSDPKYKDKRFFHTLIGIPQNLPFRNIFLCKLLIYLPLRNL
jgi:hypothetical protein